MKHYKHTLTITSEKPVQFFNLSFEVEEVIRRSMVNEGICVVISKHTTSAVFLEHDDEALYADWQEALSTMETEKSEYTVDYAHAGNAHIKALMLGSSVTVSVSEGRLDLGPRQCIMYADFNGQREKSVLIKIIGE